MLKTAGVIRRWDDARRDTNGGGIPGDIREYDGVGADPGMVPNADAAEDLGAGADIHVPADMRAAGDRPAVADGNLLKDHAVRTDDGVGMDDDAIGMGQNQSAGDVAA